MPPKEKITHTSSAVDTMNRKVTGWRAQLGAARLGINPGNPAHPHGTPWATLTVAAGGAGFTTGAYLEKRVGEVGLKIDTVLTAFQTTLGTSSRALTNTDDEATSTEKKNTDNANRLTI
ncbi:hypothetical protein [Paractinoplanes hotanensis]|uniref:Uncharacterized protein n=1 Tax=Paractinoplanes hotanensis TaxID=2906497 RepID=A0ABT0YFF3_9ACTN|nr:hypothetical protein [Actinoplanes hotanensis]MCM4084243.1 hypothetical protein [Actinoplanes hotanensis]